MTRAELERTCRESERKEGKAPKGLADYGGKLFCESAAQGLGFGEHLLGFTTCSDRVCTIAVNSQWPDSLPYSQWKEVVDGIGATRWIWPQNAATYHWSS